MIRGHVEVRIALPQSSSGGVAVLNHALLAGYLKAFREAAQAHGLDSQPDLNAALRVPGIFSEAAESEVPGDTEAVLALALDAALIELNAFRGREGAEIAAEMRTHNARVAVVAEQMERIRAGASGAFQARLSERLKELLKGDRKSVV